MHFYIILSNELTNGERPMLQNDVESVYREVISTVTAGG